MAYDQLFKIIILGSTATGKSCFLEYTPLHEMTIGVEFASKMIPVDDKTIKLQIWDTSGQEKFLPITRSYIHSTGGAILVYDITNLQSFEKLKTWEKEVSFKDYVVVVGNKVDRESDRVVKQEEGMNYAKERGYLFFETSTKTGTNVEELFAKCAQDLYKRDTEKSN